MSFALNIQHCFHCTTEQHCPYDGGVRAKIADRATDGLCPLGKFGTPADPMPPRDPNREYQRRRYQAVWGKWHRRAIRTLNPAAEMAWVRREVIDCLPGGCSCRDETERYLGEHPINFASPVDYFTGVFEFRNAVARRLGKPPGTLARAIRLHGAHDLFSQEYARWDWRPIRLQIMIDWSLGDEIILTSAIRDLHAAYPGEYDVMVGTCKSPAVFDGLPCRVGEHENPELTWQFEVSYERGVHFVDYVRHQLERVINRPVPAGPTRPQLILSDRERENPVVDGGPYWVIVPGYKLDATAKGWPQENWQRVVDHFGGRIRFVQVGAVGPEHVEQRLTGTADLTGFTRVRELISLIGSPDCQGVVSGITAPMHVGAAFGKPQVVIAGAREDDWVARYPGVEWLRSHPPCAGCWRLRVRKLGPSAPYPQYDTSICERPDGEYASCSTAITPDQVIAAIERKLAYSVIGVCTFHDDTARTWAAPCVATLEEYCRRNKYVFVRPTEKINTDRPARWQKPDILLAALEGFETVAWVDADCMITNPRVRLEEFLREEADLYISQDGNGINNGVMILRKTRRAVELLRRWRDRGPMEEKPWSDQFAFRAVAAEMPDLRVSYLDKVRFNAYCDDWTPQSLLVHFVGPSDRLTLMRDWLGRLEIKSQAVSDTGAPASPSSGHATR